MPTSHVKFHSTNGKRLILISDDEPMNRELLGMILANDYDVIYAADGQETIEQISQYKKDLSLVLLDIQMPVKSGLEVLQEVKSVPELKSIPIIVMTADQNAEVESLSLGAIDYIPKPYPQPGIILARILRAIELSEDRDIIQSTERDPLTGLYNREYFYRYAEQYDQHHRDKEMDAIVVDVNHFHMLNERFGIAYGDEVLKRIGEKIRDSISDYDGIVCRRSADVFLAYCPHGKDYKAILENAAIGLEGDENINSRVRLRMGVYANVDKNMEVERRFDRAKMAADTVRNSFTRTIGIYDDTMHERELYAEQLIDDFHKAIKEKQFVVYYQPKFDIRPKAPVLSSAEALVRWQHPTLGLVSPGVFIPLFEDNGLIQELDRYVWNEAGRQIRDWQDRLGFTVPISVNVSRIDMYDPELLVQFENVLDSNNISAENLLLEITESAYTQDSEQIIETASNLRSLGFRIEMDDFGTGYSSLNMISNLPLDALKLDMQFVRNAFKDQKDTRMLEVIIDIADHLKVPIIAEGVETEEQLLALRDLGCDIVQGYYFSKPVPIDEFEPFIVTRKGLSEEDLAPEIFEKNETEIELVKPELPTKEPRKRKKPTIHLKATNFIFATLAFLIALALVIADVVISKNNLRLEAASNNLILAEHSAQDLQDGSDYLTDSAREFAVTGELRYLNNYFEEVKETRRRDEALSSMEELLEGTDGNAYSSISKALAVSNELMEKEYLSMRLIQATFNYSADQIPSEVSSIELSAEDAALSAEEQHAKAIDIVFNDEYESYKVVIRENVSKCTNQLIESSRQSVEAIRTSTKRLLIIQVSLLSLLMLCVLGEVIFITKSIRKPLTQMVELMRKQEKVTPQGAAELQFVTNTYNDILEENQRAHKQLSYEATHDVLTGILNRSAYEVFMESTDKDHIALIIIDVDNFKTINDTYGHDVGDQILQKVAQILSENFRSVDAVCRLGGDEFVVVMTRANSSMRQLIKNKITKANDILMNPQDDLPKASLSVGVAFSDRPNPQGDIFKDADTALYKIKNGGRCGCAIYGEEED